MMNKEEQACALHRNVKWDYRCYIECPFCGDTLEKVYKHSRTDVFAAYAYSEGWRYIIYHKFGAEGTGCPSCVSECSE